MSSSDLYKAIESLGLKVNSNYSDVLFKMGNFFIELKDLSENGRILIVVIFKFLNYFNFKENLGGDAGLLSGLFAYETSWIISLVAISITLAIFFIGCIIAIVSI